MNGQIPESGNVRILVCEDVRQEMSGRFTLTGFYPDEEINVSAVGSSVPPISVSFFITISGNQSAEYAFGFEIVPPSGKNLGPRAESSIKKLANRGVVQVVKVPTLIPLEVGEWKAVIYLDQRAYEKPFRIINEPAYFPIQTST